MSSNESMRVAAFARVAAGALTLKQASRLLGISYRQTKRLHQRYQHEGPASLRHGHTGHRSNRAKPAEVRERALDFVRMKRSDWDGFGPTLAAERLESEEGLRVSQETLRRWMVEAGLWDGSRKRSASPRLERRTHFGELLTLHGGICRWPGERRAVHWIMGLADDATGTIAMRMNREPFWALAGVLQTWIAGYGIPQALQTDCPHVCVRESPAGAWLAGTSLRTQFGVMCEALGIPTMPASTMDGTNGILQVHWEQLMTEFRPRAIPSEKAVNAYLENDYVPDYNRRYARPPAAPEDLHRPCPQGLDLDAVFRLQEERPITREWRVEYRGRVFQVQRESAYAPARDKVLVSEWADRRLEIRYRGRAMNWRDISEAADLAVPRRWTAQDLPPPGLHRPVPTFVELDARGHFYRGKTRDISNEP